MCTAPAAGFRFCVHGSCLLPECGHHQRVVCLELLPHRVAHGRWAGVCVYRTRIHDYPAGNFLGWIVEAAVDFDVFRLLSYRAAVARHSLRSGHGPLYRATREAALEPTGPARGARELDHGWQPSEPDSETLLPFFRTGCSHRP